MFSLTIWRGFKTCAPGFERYEKKEYEKTSNAWSELKISGSKNALGSCIKNILRNILSRGICGDYIDGKVPPEDSSRLYFKNWEVKYVFIWRIRRGGMTADSAKRHIGKVDSKPADAVALWKGKVSVDTAKSLIGGFMA